MSSAVQESANADLLQFSYLIVKSGKFSGHLGRSNMELSSGNRFNIYILDDKGRYLRKNGGNLMHTGLVAAAFELIEIKASFTDGPISEYESAFEKEVIELRKSFGISPPRPMDPTVQPGTRPSGIPMSPAKSKLKSRKGGGGDMTKVERSNKASPQSNNGGEEDESRNNLYWVEEEISSAEYNIPLKVKRTSSTVRIGYACLWYGGSPVPSSGGPSGTTESMVRVLPIAPPLLMSRRSAVVSSRLSVGSDIADCARDLTEDTLLGMMGSNQLSAVNIDDGLTSSGCSNIGEGVGLGEEDESSEDDMETNIAEYRNIFSATDDFAAFRSVRRCKMMLLDEDDVVARYSKHQPAFLSAASSEEAAHPAAISPSHNELIKNFLLALDHFSEWDSSLRESYLWPQFLLALFVDWRAQYRFLQEAHRHPLLGFSAPHGKLPSHRHPAKTLTDIILFLLCAQHTGLSGEWDSEEFVRTGKITGNICALLDNISEYQRNDTEVTRSNCRFGTEFQVLRSAIPADLPGLTKMQPRIDQEYDEEEAGELAYHNPALRERMQTVSSVFYDDSFATVQEGSVASTQATQLNDVVVEEQPCVFAPPAHISTAELNAYLGKVQILRESTLRPNQIIEVPGRLDHFQRAWDSYWSDPANISSSTTSAQKECEGTLKYRQRCQLLEFLAFVRRSDKKLCGMCAVRQVVYSDGSPLRGNNSTPDFESYLFNDQESFSSVSAPVENEQQTVASSSTSKGQIFGFPRVEAVLVNQRPATALGTSGYHPSSYSSSPRIPIQFCRISSLPDDIALELLHACDYNQDLALQKVEALLRSNKDALGSVEQQKKDLGDSLHTNENLVRYWEYTNWKAAISRCALTPQDLDRLHQCVIKCGTDLRKTCQSINKNIERQALRQQGKVATLLAPTPPFSRVESTDAMCGAPMETSPLPVSSSGGEAPDFASPRSVEHAVSTIPSSRKESINAFKYMSMRDFLHIFLVAYPLFLDPTDIDEPLGPLNSYFNAALFTQYTHPAGYPGLGSAADYSHLSLGMGHHGNSVKKSHHKGEGGGKSSRKTDTLSGTEGDNKGRASAEKEKRKKGRSSKKGAQRPANMPNRWPRSLELVPHNLFWINHTNMPCILLGLVIKPKATDVMLSVLSICSESRRMTVSVSQVVPLTEYLLNTMAQNINKCNADERSMALASALMLFRDWEIENNVPSYSPLQKWFEYPAFITAMLKNNAAWLGWRKTVDRLPRASSIPRRDNYLLALQEQYADLPSEQRELRYTRDGVLQWDDTPLPGQSDDEGSDDEDGNSDGDGGSSDSDVDIDTLAVVENVEEDRCLGESGAFRYFLSDIALDPSGSTGIDSFEVSWKPFVPKPSKRKRNSEGAEPRSNKKSKEIAAPLIVLPPPPPKPLIPSWFNLFWIPRSQLPAMFYDVPEKRMTEKFKIVPLCCATYHYPIELNDVSKGSIETLTLSKIKQITDERTSEFTLALIDFAEWDLARQRRAANAVSSGADTPISSVVDMTDTAMDVVSDSTLPKNISADNLQIGHEEVLSQDLFEWPSFITDLVNKPRDWTSWRMATERGASRSGVTSKRHQYFLALKAQHEANLNALDEQRAEEMRKLQLRGEQEEELRKVGLAQQQRDSVAAAPHTSFGSKPKKEKVEKSEKQEKPVTESVLKQHTAPVPLDGLFDLYWLPRSNLPAVFYDDPSNRSGDTVTLLPISCSTYQYPAKVTRSPVWMEPLTENKLVACTEDRTVEFTLALIDYAQWQLTELANAKQNKENNRSLGNVSDDEEELYFSGPEKTKSVMVEEEMYFVAPPELSASSVAPVKRFGSFEWPEFVMELLNHPEKWAAWRKKAERERRDSKRQAYFAALMDDYRASLQQGGHSRTAVI